MNNLTESLIKTLADEEILHNGLGATALAQYLANKGIIYLDDFLQYQEQCARNMVIKLAQDSSKDQA